jgi:hypothetical protein
MEKVVTCVRRLQRRRLDPIVKRVTELEKA